MLKKICSNMQKNDLVFNNYIYDSCISSCCYDFNQKVTIKIEEDVSKTYNNILDMFALKKDLTEEKLKQKYPDCYYCKYRNQKNIIRDNLIYFVNLSLYPSPCQCNCIYCDIRKDKKLMTYNSSDLKQYEIIFKILDKLIENNYIANESIWQVSCGEITIHPLENKIYNFTKDKKVTYYTNCWMFDKDLSNILNTNKDAKINFSIDCGISTTWKKIKGLNNFEKTLENLSKYINASSSNQIELKYILLPKINDDNDNFQELIKFMKNKNLNKIIITRNYDEEITKELINSKDRFINLLTKNKINYELSSF